MQSSRVRYKRSLVNEWGPDHPGGDIALDAVADGLLQLHAALA